MLATRFKNLSFESQKLGIGLATGSDAAIRVANLMHYCNLFAIAVKVTNHLAASAIREVALSCDLSRIVRVSLEL